MVKNSTVKLKQLNQNRIIKEESSFYIIIDTNVLLTNLEIIEEVRDATFKNYPRSFIVISKAMGFVHNYFAFKRQCVIRQIREHAAKNKKDFSSNFPNDEILQLLLSCDKNLCTKAMIYNILSLEHWNTLERIDFFQCEQCSSQSFK
ncbi:hypothetical protein P5V15_002428 [Pogonomyrmex californicus]